MEPTKLNPTQLYLLQLFARHNDEVSLNELKDVLFDYYCKKVEEEGKRIWDEKNLNNDIMREWLDTHVRTPYK